MTTKTAPATITLKTGRTGGTVADGFKYRDVYSEVAVGDFLSESLVTDTIVWEVVKITKATVTVRPTMSGGPVHEDEHCDKGAHGLSVVWEEQVTNPEAETRTLRVRKDGSVRLGSHAGARPLYPTRKVNGVPVSRRDWRF